MLEIWFDHKKRGWINMTIKTTQRFNISDRNNSGPKDENDKGTLIFSISTMWDAEATSLKRAIKFIKNHANNSNTLVIHSDNGTANIMGVSLNLDNDDSEDEVILNYSEYTVNENIVKQIKINLLKAHYNE